MGWAENMASTSNTSSRESHSKMLISSVTTARFATNGLTKISLKQLRRLKTKPQTGSGLTTTTDPTWASVGSHPRWNWN